MKRFALCCFFTVTLIAGVGNAFQRYVVVNGQLMAGLPLLQLDAMAGEVIPNGRYWLNAYTGEWGYEGGPAQGIIGQNNQRGGAQSRSGGFFEDDVADFCARNGISC
jgi:hypothetical protein